MRRVVLEEFMTHMTRGSLCQRLRACFVLQGWTPLADGRKSHLIIRPQYSVTSARNSNNFILKKTVHDLPEIPIIKSKLQVEQLKLHHAVKKEVTVKTEHVIGLQQTVRVEKWRAFLENH